MKAVVFYDKGDIRLDDVPEPELKDSTDAIVRLTASAICGTDLHFLRGTIGGMKQGTILGHEGVGIVEQLGEDVRNLKAGDRVVIASTIACGNCSYCRAGYYAMCDEANPHGKSAGTAFFGGPESSGAFDGLQADKARIPHANIGLIKLPDSITDDQAILLSDVFPTGYFGAEMAEIGEGDTVAVFGCGPVGQFAIASAKLFGAARIFAIDCLEDRLAMARQQGAETINFASEDPIETILRLTAGIGVDRAIDAVGIDAADSPSQALDWAVAALDKAGTLSIIGAYPEDARTFPIGLAMNKNLTVNMGNCHHRRYIPHLIDLIVSRQIDPAIILTHSESMDDAIAAFKAFDRHQSGWIKVKLNPSTDARMENRLDEALDESFPASDPVAIKVPDYP